MRPNPQETAHLVTFTEEILYRKLHFLRSDSMVSQGIRIGSKRQQDIVVHLKTTDAYSEPCQASKMKFLRRSIFAYF